MSEALTPKQIENWRNVLVQMFGPYALIMPVSEIEKFRDKIERGAGNDAASAVGYEKKEV